MHDDDAVGIAKENSHSVGKEWQFVDELHHEYTFILFPFTSCT